MRRLLIILIAFILYMGFARAEEPTKGTCEFKTSDIEEVLGDAWKELEKNYKIELFGELAIELGYKDKNKDKFLQALKNLTEDERKLLIKLYIRYKKDNDSLKEFELFKKHYNKSKNGGASLIVTDATHIREGFEAVKKMQEIRREQIEIELAIKEGRVVKKKTLLQNTINVGSNIAKQYFEGKGQNEQLKLMREEAELELQRVQTLAVSEANAERDQIFNKYRLFSPKKRGSKSIEQLMNARNELAGHINSYQAQMNQALDQIKKFRQQRALNDQEIAALKKKAMSEVKANLAEQEKLVRDLKDAFETRKEGDEKKEDARVALRKAERDLKELESAINSGKAEGQINADLQGYRLNDFEIQTQIEYQNKIVMAAQTKVGILQQGLSQVDYWVQDKQDVEERDEELKKERRERLQDRAESDFYGHGYSSNDNRLFPVKRGGGYQRGTRNNQISRVSRAPRRSR